MRKEEQGVLVEGVNPLCESFVEGETYSDTVVHIMSACLRENTVCMCNLRRMSCDCEEMSDLDFSEGDVEQNEHGRIEI